MCVYAFVCLWVCECGHMSTQTQAGIDNLLLAATAMSSLRSNEVPIVRVTEGLYPASLAGVVINSDMIWGSISLSIPLSLSPSIPLIHYVCWAPSLRCVCVLKFRHCLSFKSPRADNSVIYHLMREGSVPFSLGSLYKLPSGNKESVCVHFPVPCKANSVPMACSGGIVYWWSSGVTLKSMGGFSSSTETDVFWSIGIPLVM